MKSVVESWERKKERNEMCLRLEYDIAVSKAASLSLEHPFWRSFQQASNLGRSARLRLEIIAVEKA
eukprot:1202898-Amphidinium_carterae.3